MSGIKVLTVKIGQAVQIGEAAVVKVNDKGGGRVKLAIVTAIHPITLLDDGLIPARFTTGITGELRREYPNSGPVAFQPV